MKYHYWQGVRFSATSNAQFVGSWFSGHVDAVRTEFDTYVRSVWWANFSYLSDGSGSSPGWWLPADVYFTAQFDALGIITRPAPLTSSEPTSRLALGAMYGVRTSMPEYTPDYAVQWTSAPDGLEVSGRRKGLGTAFPRVAYGVTAVDYAGYLALVVEPAAIIRCNIYGRVLWESDSP